MSPRYRRFFEHAWTASSCSQSVFSPKIRGEEHSSQHRRSHVTLTVTFARLLILRSFPRIFEEKSDCSQSRTCLKLVATLARQKLHRVAATKIACVNGPVRHRELRKASPLLLNCWFSVSRHIKSENCSIDEVQNVGKERWMFASYGVRSMHV